MQSTIPEPTPIGEPTATPRFAGLLNNLQPKIQNATLSEGIPQQEQQPSFIERVTNPNLSIVKPEEITSGLSQLKQHLEQQQEIEQQQTTNPIMKVANYAKSTA